MQKIQDKDPVAVLAARVQQLEGKVWRGRAMLAALAGAGVLAAVLGAQSEPPPVADVIRAHDFVLTDAAGRTRGELNFSKQSEPMLCLYHEDGSCRVELSVSHDGAARISAFGAKATPGVPTPVAEMHVLGPMPGWQLSDDVHRWPPRIGAYVFQEGSCLDFYDAQERCRLGMGVGVGDQPSLDMQDAAGRTLFKVPSSRR